MKGSGPAAGLVARRPSGGRVRPNRCRRDSIAATIEALEILHGGGFEVRIEVFDLFNRANFGVPNLTAFAGAADNEAALGSFGRIRNTVTSARQMQLGVRVRF